MIYFIRDMLYLEIYPMSGWKYFPTKDDEKVSKKVSSPVRRLPIPLAKHKLRQHFFSTAEAFYYAKLFYKWKE
jgi:hypothetical protein